MISLSKGAMNVGGAKLYFENHYSVRDYYTQDEKFANGYVFGKAAEALGLHGGSEITAEQFERLLRGEEPNTGIVLRTKANHGTTHRAGWDITLSPPKSVTLQALVAGDARLIEAGREAAIYAIEQAEKCALSRRHGGREWVQTANVVAVMFEHHQARESINSKHGPMPQLHHHTFIANLTQRPDGEWRGLEPKEMYKARNFIDAVYLGDLSRRVQELGYEIQRRSDDRFELAIYSRAQVEAFSERARDVAIARKKYGSTDGPLPQELREQIILETRKPKRDYDPEELRQEHRQLAIEQGIDLNYRPTAPVRTFAISPAEQAER
ncbi:MAG: relaxase domain-containing protein, partial [Deltaproteobacteria bacterium]|nr:relaxase domain-containing protein [Deltaproteobacteria bacterium]